MNLVFCEAGGVLDIYAEGIMPVRYVGEDIISYKAPYQHLETYYNYRNNLRKPESASTN